MRILSPALLAISGLAAVASASPFYMKNFAPGKPIRKPIDKPVTFKNAVLQTGNQNSTGSCDASSTLSTTKSPLQNIFTALTEEEAASVTKFLHEQSDLNLTANANATRCVVFYHLTLSADVLIWYQLGQCYCTCGAPATKQI